MRTVLLTLREATRRLTRVVEAIRFPASEQQFEDVVPAELVGGERVSSSIT